MSCVLIQIDICLAQGRRRDFYVGGRFLSQCEVSFLSETRINSLYPGENLNDGMYVLTDGIC
jgi:hypothetical protein